MKLEKLSDDQLKSALVTAWKRHSLLKKEMAPLLSELRKRLRSQGNRKGEGWGAWVEAGHIGICLRTANRWADEYEDKPTSSKKSRSGLKARTADAPVWKFLAPMPTWLNKERQQKLNKALDDLGDLKALLMFYELVTGEKVNEALATHA